jgi:hypothetical protein
MISVQHAGTVGPDSIASGEVPILARRTAIVNPLTRAHWAVLGSRSPLPLYETSLDRQSLDSGTSERSSQPLAPLLVSCLEHADTGASDVRPTLSLIEDQPCPTRPNRSDARCSPTSTPGPARGSTWSLSRRPGAAGSVAGGLSRRLSVGRGRWGSPPPVTPVEWKWRAEVVEARQEGVGRRKSISKS